MTAGTRRLLSLLLLASGGGLMEVAEILYLTWPANALGNCVRDRQNHEANIRALTMRIEREPDPLERRFYQAWLAEEKHDLPGAIQSFQVLRADTQPGTNLHLHGCLGADRQFALYLRAMVESMDHAGAFAPR